MGVAAVAVEGLVQRVVELVEGTALPPLDSASVVGALALLLVGAGLVTLRNFPTGDHALLPLLVAEPFPRVEASIGVVPAMAGVDDALVWDLRCHAQHPSVDALVVATSGPCRPLPRTIEGVPVRVAHVPGSCPG